MDNFSSWQNFNLTYFIGTFTWTLRQPNQTGYAVTHYSDILRPYDRKTGIGMSLDSESIVNHTCHISFCEIMSHTQISDWDII